AATFTVGVVTTAYSDTVSAGDVISQGLVGPAVSGTAVDLVVSDGPSPRIISGYVLEPDDVTPIENVGVIADNGGGSDVTDATGYYELTVDYGWSGIVDPNAVGYSFDPNDLTLINVITDLTDQNFTGMLDGYIISGIILDGVTPIEGVTVTPENGGGYFTNKYDGGGIGITDAEGYYEVLVDYNFSGAVTPTHNAYTFAPLSNSYSNVLADVASEDYAGTMLTFSISGYVEDILAAPIEGVVVTAQGGGGTDTTDAAGFYEVWVDYGWTNSLTAVKTDYTFTAPAAFVDVTVNYVDEDFLAKLDADIDGDGFVDVADLVIFCQNWLMAGELSDGDLDEDGGIDNFDFAELAEYWQP
ncbi:MAG: hypothetical protein KAJ07_06865, partial [Planctomycetes bacterium]|nr:hypothetical protein [Planctomycetota bacterium]